MRASNSQKMAVNGTATSIGHSGILTDILDDCPELYPTSQDYQRLEYSLKMNLRLINGKFTATRIFQVNPSQKWDVNEKLLGRTQIETMEMVTKQNVREYEELLKFKGRLNISKSNPKKFTFGSVIDSAGAIGQDTEFTFCVFKVEIGKSYCSPAHLKNGMHLSDLP